MKIATTQLFNVIILTGLFHLKQATAQSFMPFPLDSTYWATDLQSYSWGPNPQIDHHYYLDQPGSDTLIGGEVYKAIDRTINYTWTIDYAHNHCFLRSDSGEVYCRYPGDSSEFLLYSFNYMEGDTVQVPIWSGSLNYKEGVVTSVDSMLVGNEYHKRIRINTWVYLDFVEGIGSLQGLLYPEIPWVDYWGDLICYSQNDTTYLLNGTGQQYSGSCTLPTGIIELSHASLHIFPNPVTDILHVTGMPVANISIYDVHGRLILQSESNTLNLAGYPGDIYLLKVVNTEKDIFFRSILKMQDR